MRLRLGVGSFVVVTLAAGLAQAEAQAVIAVPATVVAPSPPPAAAKRMKLVVLNLVAERGVDDGVVRLLNELLLTQFTKTDRFDVVGGSDVQAIMSAEAQKQLLSGCSDSACLAELGGALGADYLAVSSLGKIGDYYLLNVKILNTKSGEVVKRWSEQVEGLENKLMLAVRKSVAAVASEDGQPPAAFDTENATIGETIATQGPAPSGSGLVAPGIVPTALWGAGGVGLLMGAIFGAKAKSAYANATDPTYIGGQKVVDGGKSSQLLANVGFGLGLGFGQGRDHALVHDHRDREVLAQGGAVGRVPLQGLAGDVVPHDSGSSCCPRPT
jgi:hypothetical protein